MKLTKKYLIKLIKEEFERESGADTKPSEELLKFVRDRLAAGRTDVGIEDDVLSSEHNDASYNEITKAIAIAKEENLEEVASAFRDLYKSIYNFKPKVKITDTIEDLKSRIKDLMDQREAQKFDELVRYAKENPPSSDDPDDMRYE